MVVVLVAVVDAAAVVFVAALVVLDFELRTGMDSAATVVLSTGVLAFAFAAAAASAVVVVVRAESVFQHPLFA